MKICMITFDINMVGGIERVMAILSRYFTEHFSWQVDILALNSEKNQNFFSLDPRIRVICGGQKELSAAQRYLFDFLRSHRNEYNVLFTFHFYISWVTALFFLRKTEVRWIATEHLSVSYFSWRRKLVNLAAYRRATVLVQLNRFSAAYYRKHGFRNVRVIPNPVSFETEEKSLLNGRTILAIGRMDYVKGYDMLLEAFAKIAPAYPDYRLRLVGDGPLRQDLERQARELSIASQVEFPGVSDRVQDELMKAEFLVITSRSECFPMVALEAMECGVPIAAFDLPSLREMTGGFPAVLFSEYGNVERMAEAMRRMIDHPEERRARGDAAKQCAGQYRISNVAQQWKSLIEGLFRLNEE